jgi:hypothetical protein
MAATAPRKVVRLAQVRAGLRAAIRLPTRVATPFALSLAPLANATSRAAAMSRTTMAALPMSSEPGEGPSLLSDVNRIVARRFVDGWSARATP